MGEVEITEPEAYGVDDRATATATGAVVDDEDDVNERVLEWEMGLPNCDDLTPLSQSLIPPELASAFSISPETCRTAVDVNRASQNTLSSLRSTGAHSSNNINNDNNKNFRCLNEPMVVEPERDGSGSGSATEPKKMRKMASPEEADSAVRTTMENSEDPSRGKALKRHRLVWTPQLHKRFVDVVAHLGIKNAVPKTIMQLMNVDGLTRENVASHLQKYRLYLKRMQGQSDEGPSASDQLFASTPVPQSLRENGTSVGGGSVNSSGHVGMAIPMPYGTPMIPMPMYRPAHHHHQNGYEANSYGMMQQRDWSGGNKFGSFVSYPPHRMAPNEKLH